MSNNPSRRDFLVYSGATIAGVTLGETGRRWLGRIDDRAAAWRDRGVETWANTICRECAAGCGVRVRQIDGVPVKIEGNPLCPIARGRACAKGLAAIESYFDPDRLVGPARRTGRGGDPRWQPASWGNAVALAAEHLKRAGSSADGIVAIAADERGVVADAWTRLWSAAGAHLAWTPLRTAARLRPRLRNLTGADGDPVFDLEHASYALSFGAPVADDWLSGVWAQRTYGRFRRGQGSNRGRLVQIEGRRSLTARKADEWLAVPADHQAALAHGIASMLFRENRIDRDRLEPIAGNLRQFERQVVTYYTPDNVSAETGVPVVTILRLARELVSTPQPVVVVDAGAAPELIDAVLSLNVLIGAIDRQGGLFAKTGVPAPAREDAGAVLRDIADGRIRPSVLVLADSSALRTLVSLTRPETLVEKVPFIISFSPYIDEAASIADLILPTDMPMESWHAMVPPTAMGVDAVAVTKPAVKRRLDTQDKGTLLRSLADALGGPVAQACSWRSSEDLVRAEVVRLAGLRRGTIYTSTYETDWTQQLESGGWWAPSADSDTAFAEQVIEAGGWIEPFFDSRQLTESLSSGRGLSFPLPDVLPVARQASGSAAADARFPIELVAFQPSIVDADGHANQPVLYELLGQPDSLPWALWVEVAPDVAERLGLPERARVRIVSAHDSLEAVAVVVPGMSPGAAALSFVPGARTGGRWSRLISNDPRRLWGDASPSGPCAVQIVRL
jgi:anaerobic selenocysteine-containing dehydrogenase